jgi:hypothetical protein
MGYIHLFLAIIIVLLAVTIGLLVHFLYCKDNNKEIEIEINQLNIEGFSNEDYRAISELVYPTGITESDAELLWDEVRKSGKKISQLNRMEVMHYVQSLGVGGADTSGGAFRFNFENMTTPAKSNSVVGNEPIKNVISNGMEHLDLNGYTTPSNYPHSNYDPYGNSSSYGNPVVDNARQLMDLEGGFGEPNHNKKLLNVNNPDDDWLAQDYNPRADYPFNDMTTSYA